MEQEQEQDPTNGKTISDDTSSSTTTNTPLSSDNNNKNKVDGEEISKSNSKHYKEATTSSSSTIALSSSSLVLQVNNTQDQASSSGGGRHNNNPIIENEDFSSKKDNDHSPYSKEEEQGDASNCSAAIEKKGIISGANKNHNKNKEDTTTSVENKNSNYKNKHDDQGHQGHADQESNTNDKITKNSNKSDNINSSTTKNVIPPTTDPAGDEEHEDSRNHDPPAPRRSTRSSSSFTTSTPTSSSPLTTEKANKNPYLHKTVRIIRGQFEGLTGKVVKIHTRGWWSLDNPEMDGKNIHPRICELVDHIEPSKLENFYKYRSKSRSLPSIILRQQEQAAKRKRDDLEEDDNEEEEEEREEDHTPREARRHRPTRRAATKHTQSSSPPKKQKSQDSTKNESEQCHTDTSQKLGFDRTKRIMITSTLKGTSKLRQQSPSRSGNKKRRARIKHVSSPFILNTEEDGYKANEALQHLPSNYKVKIFNRKSGRILQGNEAVSLKNLPSLLRRHAEYEPLIPSPRLFDIDQTNRDVRTSKTNNQQECLPRAARSSTNARINEFVQPQTRVRASTAEGCRVKITAGPYRDLMGRIESCIPGNWYLVSDLSKANKFDLDYIVHSKHLEIVPEKSEKVKHRKKKGEASHAAKLKDADVNDSKLTLPLKNVIKSLQASIESMKKKKLKFKSSDASKGIISLHELKMLDEQLNATERKLETKMLSLQMLEGSKTA